MNKEQLEKLSDFEINKLVYESDGLEPTEMQVAIIGMVDELRRDSYEMKLALGTSEDYYGKDYCNNWSVMGDLIHKHKISISPIQPYTDNCDKDLWCASAEINRVSVEVWHRSPLRAAAIVYLLMQEGKK